MRTDSMEKEMFRVNMGLGWEYEMSSWLFNLDMDGVMREVYTWVMGQGGWVRAYFS